MIEAHWDGVWLQRDETVIVLLISLTSGVEQYVSERQYIAELNRTVQGEHAGPGDGNVLARALRGPSSLVKTQLRDWSV